MQPNSSESITDYCVTSHHWLLHIELPSCDFYSETMFDGFAVTKRRQGILQTRLMRVSSFEVLQPLKTILESRILDAEQCKVSNRFFTQKRTQIKSLVSLCCNDFRENLGILFGFENVLQVEKSHHNECLVHSVCCFWERDFSRKRRLQEEGQQP